MVKFTLVLIHFAVLLRQVRSIPTSAAWVSSYSYETNFYSVDPSSNPAEVYSFKSVNCLKIGEKEPGDGQSKKVYENGISKRWLTVWRERFFEKLVNQVLYLEILSFKSFPRRRIRQHWKEFFYSLSIPPKSTHPLTSSQTREAKSGI